MFNIKVQGNIFIFFIIVFYIFVLALVKSLVWIEQSLLLQLKIEGFNSMFGVLIIRIKVKKQKFLVLYYAIFIIFCNSISKIYVKQVMFYEIILVIKNVI